MLHVFNGPVEPVSLSEFQKTKGKKTLFPYHTKQEVIYHEDGRRFVDNKIENERSASNLWTTALACSVAHDLKERSNEDFTLRNLGFMRYVFYLLQQFVRRHGSTRTTLALMIVNILLIVLFLYFFIF